MVGNRIDVIETKEFTCDARINSIFSHHGQSNWCSLVSIGYRRKNLWQNQYGKIIVDSVREYGMNPSFRTFWRAPSECRQNSAKHHLLITIDLTLFRNFSRSFHDPVPIDCNKEPFSIQHFPWWAIRAYRCNTSYRYIHMGIALGPTTSEQRSARSAQCSNSACAIVAKPDNANWHQRSGSKPSRNSPRIQRKAECRRIRNGISELCDCRRV